MWNPFKKKTPGQRHVPGVSIADYLYLDDQHRRLCLDGFWTQYRITEQRQSRKEVKVELHTGKYYETKDSVHQCWQHGTVNDWVVIGKWFYTKSGRPIHIGAPAILREVPAPLNLEVGALYAMSNGKVEWCELSAIPGVYQVGPQLYYGDGAKAWMTSSSAPRILHKIRLNEHLKREPGELFQERVKAAEKSNAHKGRLYFGMDLAGDAYDEMAYMRVGGGIDNASAVRDLLGSGCIAPFKIHDTSYGLDGVTAPKPMKVTYKPHTECGKREVDVPSGYELIREAVGSLDGLLMAENGFWVPALWGSANFRETIRPKFRVTRPGWYAVRQKSAWLKIDALEMTMYREDGKRKDGYTEMDLIARATPAQAKILEGL